MVLEDTVPPGARILTTAGNPVSLTLTPTAPEAEANFGYARDPTYIHLASFDAQRTAGGALITWSTAVEVDHLGYNIYRAEPGGGTRIRVNHEFVPGRGSSLGGSYALKDPAATPGRPWSYWLEEIDTRFVSHWYGPVALPAALRACSMALTNDHAQRSTRSARGMVLGWASREGSTYTIWVASDIAGVYEPVATEISATPPRNLYWVPGAAGGSRFFRVEEQ
jgi:hypothetical protein